MKKTLLVLLLAASAGAQNATTAPLTLWVNTTGSDGNTCLFPNQACASIQGALDKLGTPGVQFMIRHGVTINVAAGTYTTGFAIDRFSFANAVDPSVGAWLEFVGALANSTLATGSATGTATGATASSGTAYGTLTDSGAAWTVNDLRHRFLATTSGLGSGQFVPICSNTATVITVCGGWTTTPDTTTQYAIQDSASILTGAVPRAALPGSTGVAAIAASSFGQTVFVTAPFSANSTLAPRGPVIFSQLAFLPSSPNTAIQIIGPSNVWVRNCQFTNSGTSGCSINVRDSASLRASNVSFKLTTTGACAFGTAQARTVNIFNGIVRNTNGGGFGLLAGSGTTVFTISGLQLSNLTTGIAIAGSAAQTVQSSTRIDCENFASSAGINMQTYEFQATTALGPQWNETGSDISNCPTAVFASGSVFYSAISVGGNLLTGTGNTTVFNFSKGATARIASTATITGTTEISLDGDTFTLAQMRALNPAAISNLTYGTRIFQ